MGPCAAQSSGAARRSSRRAAARGSGNAISGRWCGEAGRERSRSAPAWLVGVVRWRCDGEGVGGGMGDI
jgi:hypothetical protein